MFDQPRSRTRYLFALLMTAAMLLASIPVGLAGAAGDSGAKAGPRAVVDDANDLIIPEGETYELSGCHTYAKSVQVNGTLVVKPYDGTAATSGMLGLSAPWIIVGPTGMIVADGRGYGGGGGGSSLYTNSQGGYGGTGGNGGNGADAYQWYYCGGGGGGSNGGRGGQPGQYGGFDPGTDGDERKGGDGGGDYWGWGDAGGKGGAGFGGGGGGGGDDYYGGGGGGGGGSGGKDAVWNVGGDGGGSFGGKGGQASTYGSSPTQAGNPGGYKATGKNGDTSMDLEVVRGSGGGGGGSGNYYCGGGAGGGGAGGGSVSLISDGDMSVEGTISTTGSTGGDGGTTWGSYTSGKGGGGAGGGVAMVAVKLSVSGMVDARGRIGSKLDTVNGGTIKMSYLEKNIVLDNLFYGRLFANGKPSMRELISPGDGATVIPYPVFVWNSGFDPDKDVLTYHFQVASATDFEVPLIDLEDIAKTTLVSPIQLSGGAPLYWRVRCKDAIGYGNWSATWSFEVDNKAPTSSVMALPKWTTTTDFTVNWSGTDVGVGLANYTILVSDNNAMFFPWLPGVTITSAVFPGRDGHSYRFYSLAHDLAGNREGAKAAADASTTVDISPPVSTMTALPAFLNITGVELAWKATDLTSGVKDYTVYVSDNGGEFTGWLNDTTEKTKVYTGAEGHQYQFYVRARDVAGNTEEVPAPERFVSVSIDLTAPLTTATIGWPSFGEGPVYILPANEITLRASDNYAGVNFIYYYVDGQPMQEYNRPVKESMFGYHNLTYWSVDIAGNPETPRKLWFFTDGEAPTTYLSYDGPNFVKGTTVYISGSTLLVLEGRDRGSGVKRTEFNIENANRETYNGPFKMQRPGSHTLYFRSIDNLGTAEADKTQKLILDTSVPTTMAVFPLGPQKTDIDIKLRASDPDSGVLVTKYRYLYTSDEGVVGEYTEWRSGTSFTIQALENQENDGTFHIEFYSTDNVGNNESVKSINIEIDTETDLRVDLKGSATVDTDTYTITGWVEPGSRLIINGEPVQILSDGNFSYEATLSEGENKFNITATDPAGNTYSVTRSVTYTPPANLTWLLLVVAVVVIAVVLVVALVLMTRKKPGPPVMDQRTAAPPK